MSQTYSTGYPQGQDQNQGQYYPPQQQAGYQQQGYPQQGGYQQPPQQGGYQQGGYQPQQQTQITIHVDPGMQNDPNFVKGVAIMNNEFCGCCSDPMICLASSCFPFCIFGYNYSVSGQGSFLCCCFYPCLACSSRDYIYRSLGLNSPGCLVNCLVHWCAPLHICSLTQETRAIKHLNLAKARSRPVMM